MVIKDPFKISNKAVAKIHLNVTNATFGYKLNAIKQT